LLSGRSKTQLDRHLGVRDYLTAKLTSGQDKINLNELTVPGRIAFRGFDQGATEKLGEVQTCCTARG
jgi:hypothetical protein